MRFIEIKIRLREILPNLAIKTARLSGANIKISAFKKAKEAIIQLKELSIFTEIINDILSIEEISLAVHDEIVLPQNIANNFTSKFNQLKTHCAIFLKGLEELVPDQAEETINIKLPENGDLNSYAQLFEKIEKILSQLLINKYLNGEVKLIGFDTGTNWLMIFVGSNAAVMFLFQLMRFYFEFKERELSLKTKELLFEDLKLRHETRGEILSKIKEKLENEFEEGVDKIFSKYKIPADDIEYKQRVKYALNQFEGLLKQGIEIHPALISRPEEVQLPLDHKKMLEVIKSLPDQET